MGFDPSRFLQVVRYSPQFVKMAYNFYSASRNSRFPFRLEYMRPILSDFNARAGEVSGHYFHQDLWAARKIHASYPVTHIDIGSRMDGFVAHLLTFMQVKVIDIRPLHSDVEGLTFIQEDATELSSIPNDSVESISTLHVVEHFGLGRYGDPIDPDAPFKAMRTLIRVLKPGGRLYFSVPIGIERVEFNAHRVFAPQTLSQEFARLQLVSFSAINDAGNFCNSATPDQFEQANFACGLFEFTKPIE